MAELTDEFKSDHEAADNCHISFQECNDPENKKVRDHCDCIPGAVHNNFYLEYLTPNYIFLVLHNLSDNDSRVFIKELRVSFNNHDTGLIAGKKEKYISFNVTINLK